MKIYVAVTDERLFQFLRTRPDLDEINFLQPGGKRRFLALQPGEPFLFKLHSPRHFVVGGGFFAHSSLLPASLAWEVFREGNGAVTPEALRRRIQKYRRQPAKRGEDYDVGSIILERPFYFDEADWLEPPKDFSKSIVQGKVYDTSTPIGKSLWEDVRLRMSALHTGRMVEPQAEMFGEPPVAPPRLGPGAFRILVTDAYDRCCAMTGDGTLPALEVAHIRPPAQGGLHRVDNGLLLRSDLRRLFDQGYLTLGDDFSVRVSSSLHRDYPASDIYCALEGLSITIPDKLEHQPRSAFLDWHRRRVFHG
jgi:putative restriction endonuclease